MPEQSFYHALIIIWLIIAGLIFISLYFIVAPYGRHATRKWGPVIRSRTGWIVMESTSPLVFAACFVLGNNRNTIPSILFLALWEAHYIHRAFIYPVHFRGGQKSMPVMVIGLGFLFNAVNSYLNGRYIFTFSSGYPDSWLSDPRFIIGVLIFVLGFIINRDSDLILRSLRQPGEYGYRIANRGLFRWISCPNYLGEILIWTGWAVATWSLAGLSFAVWTAANLVPRARAHHHWYRETFPNYPVNRHALIPGIW